MRDYNHWAVLGALSELLPQPENRVTLADEKDQFGMPRARFDYTQCENDRRNIAYAKQTLHDIWDSAGAQDVLTIDRYAHLVGGCRMGTSPENSVVGADHLVWGTENVFVADGSVMPTQGSANPALTIMVLASRLAELLVRKRVGRGPPAGVRGSPPVAVGGYTPADTGVRTQITGLGGGRCLSARADRG
jgi:choline dehydrogenase-like flavoprotein